ncbi:chromosome partitioning protein [Lentzea sp. NPDC051838]|uniref:chromosome partitioning protein n=1 Tax=Lentzea sp. NPDC051838 TaxID=3154849 RepID=UPI00342AE884
MLIAVCSLKGSPGVTTLATALGARWPGQQNPIVVEVDPAGGDLMARFRLRDTPGLVSLAAATRRRGGTDPNLLAQHAQLLPGGLRVVLGPVGAEQARAALGVLALGPLSPLRRAADQSGSTVIADCGRVDPDSPALAIIRSADVMLLVARPHDDELAHVALKLQVAQQWSRRPCFVLIGDGYPTPEVSQTLRVPVMARVPRDIKGAAALCGQSISRRGLSKSALGRAAAKIALNVHVTSQQPIHDGTHAPQLQLARPGEATLSAVPQLPAPSLGNGVVAP